MYVQESPKEVRHCLNIEHACTHNSHINSLRTNADSYWHSASSTHGLILPQTFKKPLALIDFSQLAGGANTEPQAHLWRKQSCVVFQARDLIPQTCRTERDVMVVRKTTRRYVFPHAIYTTLLYSLYHCKRLTAYWLRLGTVIILKRFLFYQGCIHQQLNFEYVRTVTMFPELFLLTVFLGNIQRKQQRSAKFDSWTNDSYDPVLLSESKYAARLVKNDSRRIDSWEPILFGKSNHTAQPVESIPKRMIHMSRLFFSVSQNAAYSLTIVRSDFERNDSYEQVFFVWI